MNPFKEDEAVEGLNWRDRMTLAGFTFSELLELRQYLEERDITLKELLSRP